MQPDMPRYRLPNYKDYPTNQIFTSKYTWLTFIPKNLWEQFHRWANIYFCIIVGNYLEIQPSIPIRAISFAFLSLLAHILFALCPHSTHTYSYSTHILCLQSCPHSAFLSLYAPRARLINKNLQLLHP